MVAISVITSPNRIGERRTASSSISASICSASGCTSSPPLRITSRKNARSSSASRVVGTSSTSWFSIVRHSCSTSSALPLANMQPFSVPTLAPVMMAGVHSSSCKARQTPTW